MLTAEQIEAAIVMIGHFDASERDQTIMGEMYATAAAMRTPITAEALTEAGWRLDYEVASNGNFSGRKMFVFGDRTLAVSIWGDGNMCLYHKGNGDPLPMPSNMHDLTELVRLLGGSGKE